MQVSFWGVVVKFGRGIGMSYLKTGRKFLWKWKFWVRSKPLDFFLSLYLPSFTRDKTYQTIPQPNIINLGVSSGL